VGVKTKRRHRTLARTTKTCLAIAIRLSPAAAAGEQVTLHHPCRMPQASLDLTSQFYGPAPPLPASAHTSNNRIARNSIAHAHPPWRCTTCCCHVLRRTQPTCCMSALGGSAFGLGVLVIYRPWVPRYIWPGLGGMGRPPAARWGWCLAAHHRHPVYPQLLKPSATCLAGTGNTVLRWRWPACLLHSQALFLPVHWVILSMSAAGHVGAPLTLTVFCSRSLPGCPAGAIFFHRLGLA